MMYALVRIKSTINANKAVRDTLKMLNLPRVNSCTIIHYTDSYKGMLQKVKDYITWGELDDSALKLLMKKTQIKDVTKATDDLKGGTKLGDITKPSIGLHPPKKGYEGIKKPFSTGGSYGYRGKKINDLIKRMI